MRGPGSDPPDARAVARLRAVTADLAAETRSLQEVLDAAGPGRWATPTPAAGWTVQDQVHHLAFFDEATVLAATDPGRFRHEAAELTAPGDDFPDRLVRGQRSLTPERSAAWATRARAALLDLAAGAPPGLRLPWYGPDMGITSALTARLMETWAHGQDVADALGVVREPTTGCATSPTSASPPGRSPSGCGGWTRRRTTSPSS
ncbi:maleylpyruvate isomerase family mycothiol-dependent enzyme [Geodermatophilus sp. SYSU D00766]